MNYLRNLVLISNKRFIFFFLVIKNSKDFYNFGLLISSIMILKDLERASEGELPNLFLNLIEKLIGEYPLSKAIDFNGQEIATRCQRQ